MSPCPTDAMNDWNWSFITRTWFAHESLVLAKSPLASES